MLRGGGSPTPTAGSAHGLASRKFLQRSASALAIPCWWHRRRKVQRRYRGMDADARRWKRAECTVLGIITRAFTALAGGFSRRCMKIRWRTSSTGSALPVAQQCGRCSAPPGWRHSLDYLAGNVNAKRRAAKFGTPARVFAKCVIAYLTQESGSRATHCQSVMAGAGPPSTTALRAAHQVVDGRHSPAMTQGLPPVALLSDH
jgi:hypothetical protein